GHGKPERDSKNVLLRDVARVEEQKVVGEYDRYNMQRMVSMTANIEGEDLGRVAAEISQSLARVNESLWLPHQDAQGKPGWKNEISGEVVESKSRPTAPPRGMAADVRGQVAPMKQMFGKLGGGKYREGLSLGLAISVIVIFLLLTAYFQSIRLALISVSA